jgi:uncharacterized membrane protein
VAEFFNTWFFHWVPAKAIWIGGHTLSWDARCAGIYAGFGAGVLCRFAISHGRGRKPSAPLLALGVLFMLPLFADVLSLFLGYRLPSNDVRFLTGLLFGGGLSACLVSALAFLLRPGAAADWAPGTGSFFALIAGASAAVFLLKDWDSIAAYGLIEALCLFGCLSLAAILAVGTFRAAGFILEKKDSAKGVLVLVLICMLSACAAPQRVARTGACDEKTFVPSPNVYGDCRKEVCRDGRITLIEDLVSPAPVDDWAEEKFCLLHPIDCLRAYSLKTKTEEWQKENTGRYWTQDELRNGLGDATRHAYMMCLMAEKFGADFARGVGVAHEEDSEYLIFTRKAAPSNPCCEKVMDLYNNEIGIALAARPGTCEEKVLGSLDQLKYLICRRGDKGEGC